jgi:hypothetical protein
LAARSSNRPCSLASSAEGLPHLQELLDVDLEELGALGPLDRDRLAHGALEGDRGDQGLVARVHEAPVVALGEAIYEVSEEDAKSFFEHCGYREAVQLL